MSCRKGRSAIALHRERFAWLLRRSWEMALNSANPRNEDCRENSLNAGSVLSLDQPSDRLRSR
ncbi:MAG: hypothetical protein SFW36_03615 [Leptolyngbyaceae cyanobacterium bins.59]|nr:hypothetical protein [Leptolyngbyaceae cyanobacterium bins.59]